MGRRRSAQKRERMEAEMETGRPEMLEAKTHRPPERCPCARKRSSKPVFPGKSDYLHSICDVGHTRKMAILYLLTQAAEHLDSDY
ncbi:uncharacterized protein ARB_00834 [Trichophyton benhamiae CBS 112371]|uniref:Uncharacterized protein n=1 Tax=Arthroderma benhamiae (strain ATCC MYA-4681 / CBS 112371) TaxID=663331 RepID=D4AXA6_ARTBC|nr:uncharacterized protein ARB_00834 [Trichophyton benhamiae CBS 112371]EFE32311.1 hypothetical protein ARB_00834 [Trichophyton benhamiae CBS 112371]